MPPADPQSRPDEDERGVAIAEGDDGVGQTGAAVDVAVLAHEVLAVGRDLPRPATATVNGQLEDFGGDMAHPEDTRTPVPYSRSLSAATSVVSGVAYGFRTRNLRSHNPMLCLLS